MAPVLQTREDAIQWLRSKGLYAHARDRVLGQTICVASEKIQKSPDDIAVFRYMVCIYPDGKQWCVIDFSAQLAGEECKYDSLKVAAQKAVDILSNKHRSSQD